MYNGINTVQEEEGARNKSGLVWGAKIPGKHLESPMDKQKLQNSPQEVKGVSGFSKLYAMTRMTGQNRNTSCVLFLWHLLTQLLASLPFGKKLAIIWRLACFQQPQRNSVLPGAILCWHRRIKPELLHVRFPLSTTWLALVYWRPTTGEAEMEKIAEHLRTNSRKTTNKSFSLPTEEALRTRI